MIFYLTRRGENEKHEFKNLGGLTFHSFVAMSASF